MRAGLLCAILLLPAIARATNVLTVQSAQLDRPTVTTLGMQVLIANDDNQNASIALQYRVAGTTAWRAGPPLHRVHPEFVVGNAILPQFAGSLFDLAPDTAYDLELHAIDPDGPVDQLVELSGRTRAIPGDPATPRQIPVSNATKLSAALSNAQPGDVITLAAGTYLGMFSFTASGTAANPIVIRGVDRDAVILDGQNCVGCNVIESYGSYVHVEQLTIQNAERALRFQAVGGTGNVVRRVHIRDVTLGIAGKADQTDFYICDNIVEGRLSWPLTYADDSGAHGSEDGIAVTGSGHVVCHNQVQGFSDALTNFQRGTRANDFYGNDVRFAYGDGIWIDDAEGNMRVFRNRFANVFDGISMRGIRGGPAYVFRNAVVNVPDQAFRVNALVVGGTAPNQPAVGVLLQNNTFVRAGRPIDLYASDPAHDYAVQNNIFIGSSADGGAVQWQAPIDFTTGTIDWNGYSPDGAFAFGYGDGGQLYSSFANVQAGGRYEANGVLLAGNVFASGLQPPAAPTVQMPPPDVALASASPALDRGTRIPGFTDGFTGAAPDLGAQELGCGTPLYGVRPLGVDERNEPTGCIDGGFSATDGGAPDGGPVSNDGGSPSDGGAPGGDGGVSAPDGGSYAGSIGCGCGPTPASFVPWAVAAVLVLARPGRRRA